MSEDRCVCCGQIIPEGTMVCPTCQEPPEMYEGELYSKGLLAAASRGSIYHVADWAGREAPFHGDCEIKIRRIRQ